jgi:cytochrome P450
MPAFHGSRMQNYGQLVADLTNKVLQEAAKSSPKNSLETNTFFVRDEMQSISLQIILQAVFGLHEGDRANRVKYLMGQMTELFRSPLTSAALFFTELQRDLGSWSPWGNFIRQRAKLDQLIYQEIADRRATLDPDQTDILTMLLSAADEDGNGMTDIEVRDELLALLFAGHETTATAMSWALYWIQ